MKNIIIALLLLFSIILNAQQQLIINSSYLVSPDTVWVFTPNNGDLQNALPVVYLLHGWAGNYHYWDDIIDCQSYANKYNAIIVCPDGLYDSWYINSPANNENDWSTFFSWDLAPVIAENYNIQQDSIFVTGLSMGGHGALYLFETFTEYFRSAGSLSGLLDLTDWSEHYGISRILGLSDSENPKELLKDYSVIWNIEKLKTSENGIIVSCGTEDPLYNINIATIDVCKENDIDVKFISSKGSHNSSYWRSAIDGHFEFFFK